MKRIAFFFFLLIPGWSVFAQFSLSEGETPQQVVFPLMKEYSDKLITIQPTWKPSKQFLKDNPNFLKDGSYKLNSGMLSKSELRLMDMYPYYPSRFRNMNSGTFPATVAQSDKKLDFVDMVHFTFTMSNEAGIKLPLSKKWMLVDEVSAEVEGLEALCRRYDERFTSAVQQLVFSKGIPQYEVSPVPSSLYGQKEISINGLVFDFQCLGVWSYSKNYPATFFWLFAPPLAYLIPPTPNYWIIMRAKRPGGDYYPSNAIFRLNVKDVTGNIIKTYQQAIFVGEKHILYKTNQRSAACREILLSSLPVAMESLINRFLNDEQTLATTKKHLLNLADKQNANPNILELAKAQAKVNMLYRRKASFAWRIGINVDNINQMGSFARELPRAMAQQQQLNNAIYSSAAQQQVTGLSVSALNMIGGMMADKAIKRNTQEANRIAGLYQATEEEENRYVAQIAELMESDADLSAMVSKSKSVNQFFQDELKRVAQAKEVSQQQTAALKEVVKETFSKSLMDFAARNNIDLAQMSAIASGETPPPSSTGSSNSAAKSGSTAKSGKTATDACARQYEAAWRNSAEYKKWKSTGNYADQCMAEWKQGMLILQYCGSVLSPAEKAAIQKVAEQCRQRANQVKSANTGGIRF